VKGVTDTRFVGSVGLSWRLHRAGQIP
jgi:hypothetical protein